MFTRVVAETMRDAGCTDNSCVEAACIGVGVAHAFGFVAEPVPVAVRAVAGNTAIVLPGPNREGRRRGFDAHLILHFAGNAFVDLTARQFNRPDRGLLVPGPIVVYDAPRDRLAAWATVPLRTGTTVSYRELDDDVTWRMLPAWTESSALTIRVATRNLRTALGNPRGRSSTG